MYIDRPGQFAHPMLIRLARVHKSFEAHPIFQEHMLYLVKKKKKH